jgi:DNA-3-methyladenine glycosylase II
MLTFNTADDCEQALRACAARDARVSAALKHYGHPPFWQRPAGFAALAQIILEQQVSLASALAVHGRVTAQIKLNASANELIPNAVLELGADGLGRLGVTRPKQRALLALASACEQRTLDLEALSHASNEAVHAALTAITGIGPWTANVYLIMALRRADAWPEHDVAVHEAMKHMDNLNERPHSKAALERARDWQPYRAAVARLLWHIRLVQTKRSMHI